MTCLTCGDPIDQVTHLQLHPGCEVDLDAAATDVFSVVRDAILNQPRSLQTMLGPSEIGHPCARRLGHKLNGTKPLNKSAGGVAWKPFIGTAVHDTLAGIFANAETARWNDDTVEHPRWLVEERVNTGTANGIDVDGNADLFDVANGIVWDWKITTKNMIDKTYIPKGPGRQYKTQAHLYGRGWERRGFQVRAVGIIFLTRDGEYSTRHVWAEAYDEQVAVDALARVGSIDEMLKTLGPDIVLPLLPAAESYCGHCAYFRIGETDLALGCPGVNKDGTDKELIDNLFPN